MVSWLDRPEECREIEVPVPLNTNKRKPAPAAPPPKRARGEEGQQGNQQGDADTHARILEMVQEQVKRFEHMLSLYP